MKVSDKEEAKITTGKVAWIRQQRKITRNGKQQKVHFERH